MKRAHAALRNSLLGLIAGVLLGGCRSSPATATFDVGPGEYAQAFDQARDTVREWGFELDRVDAARGIITTIPRESAGFATPWVNHARGFGDAWEDTMNPRRRMVEVRFVDPTDGSADEPDLRAVQGPLQGQVIVTVLGLHRPWRRLDSTSIRFSSVSFDPAAIQRGESGAVEEVIGEDAKLAGVLAGEITSRSE